MRQSFKLSIVSLCTPANARYRIGRVGIHVEFSIPRQADKAVVSQDVCQSGHRRAPPRASAGASTAQTTDLLLGAGLHDSTRYGYDISYQLTTRHDRWPLTSSSFPPLLVLSTRGTTCFRKPYAHFQACTFADIRQSC